MHELISQDPPKGDFMWTAIIKVLALGLDNVIFVHFLFQHNPHIFQTRNK